MKRFGIVLCTLIVLLQYPLWIGKGSWWKVWEIDRQVVLQSEINQKLQTRNEVMSAEIKDLKQGLDAIEERARNELGMIKRNEVFFQVRGTKKTDSSSTEIKEEASLE